MHINKISDKNINKDVKPEKKENKNIVISKDSIEIKNIEKDKNDNEKIRKSEVKPEITNIINIENKTEKPELKEEKTKIRNISKKSMIHKKKYIKKMININDISNKNKIMKLVYNTNPMKIWFKKWKNLIDLKEIIKDEDEIEKNFYQKKK